jgi:hypothetical protein
MPRDHDLLIRCKSQVPGQIILHLR